MQQKLMKLKPQGFCVLLQKAVCLILFLIPSGCVLRHQAQSKSLDPANKEFRLQEIRQALGQNQELLSNLTLANLEQIDVLPPEFSLQKVKIEERALENGLLAAVERGNQKRTLELGDDFDFDEISIDEKSFGFIGRIEARRKKTNLSDLSPEDGKDQAENTKSVSNPILFNDVLIWPPDATSRLILQLRQSMALFAKNSGLTHPLTSEESQKYEKYYQSEEPRFRFADCVPRFSPGEYVDGGGGGGDDGVQKETNDESEMHDAILEKLKSGWLSRNLGFAKEPQTRALSNPIKTFKDCEKLFSSDYDRWEFDFLIVRDKAALEPVYYQEIHIRTRVFWAKRLTNGPLNGNPELQKTAVFRSAVPLDARINLRVFGNISKPKPLTIPSHELGSEFDDKTREALLENYGVNFLQAKNRIIGFLASKGFPVQVNEGRRIEDLTELFKVARIWNFTKVTLEHVLKASSVPAAAGLALHGMQDLSAYEITDLLVPSNYGHFTTSLFTGIVVPSGVMVRRVVDTLEIDYLVKLMKSEENPKFRKFIQFLQVFDYAMAGLALGNGAVFVSENWQGIVNVFYTTHVVKALTEAWHLYFKGADVTNELMGPLLTDSTAHFNARQAEVLKILSDAREKRLQKGILNKLNDKLGTNLSVVNDLHKLSEGLRDLALWRGRGSGELQDRTEALNRYAARVVHRAYCDAMQSADMADFLKKSDQDRESAAAVAENIAEAIECER